ncbi:DUF6602 domain-containing protein [Dietzia timorensis]|uniref:DUF6602 domain-containing protein n=1 Tax=Dietzia timorensis TaxID=499555 RepID=A0A173LNC5_9ACTN|nr:DUF6602 domain-containing protein [Dietzia timorensis]ANI93403.1 Hypothetical protein BJL86_2643 [Dietzia timorensis]
MSDFIRYEDASEYTFGNLGGYAQKPTGNHLNWLELASSRMERDYEEAFERASKRTGRSQESGMQTEAAWASFLENWLPPQYEVVQNKHIYGEVETGEDPDETDIVVLRPSYPTSLRKESHILVSGVAAAFSVKSTLNSSGIQEAADSCARLHRTLAPREGTARKELTRPFVFGLLASSHTWKKESSSPRFNMSKQLFEADQNFASTPAASLDMACVLDLGTWNHITSVSPPTPIPTQLVEDLSAEDREAAIESFSTMQVRSTFALNPANREGDVLASFLTSLYSRLALEDRELKSLADSFSLMGADSGGRDRSRDWEVDQILSPAVSETNWQLWDHFTFGAPFSTTYGWHVPW